MSEMGVGVDVPAALNGSGSSVGNTPFNWRYEHAKGFPITEDSEGMACVDLHYKSVGCKLPSLNKMSEKELYITAATANGKVWFLL